VLLLTGLVACAEPEPTTPFVIAQARGGGSNPQVKRADPDEAEQGATLPVQVIGSGFDEGSVVAFLLAGQTTTKMVVHETRFLSGSTLEADLTVASDAEVALYDIEVTTTRGKKGIGTEKFSVKLTGPPPPDIPVLATFRDAVDDGVKSDGGAAYDATILELGNMFIDARASVPRELCLNFQDADQPPAPDDLCHNAYMSTADPSVVGGMRDMAVGSSITSRAQVTWGMDQRNWFLRFGMDCSLDDDTANRIVVTHPDDDTWVLEGHNARLCTSSIKGRPTSAVIGDVFSMPFQITLVRK